MPSGGLLGGPSGRLGPFIRDESVGPRTEGNPVRKSGKRKLALPGVGLY